MEPAKVFPIYQLQDAFEAFCHGEPDMKPQHRSLYYFLLGYCRRRGNTPRFSLTYEAGMHGSGIGSWATYDSAMKALHTWGFIRYTPGANRFKMPVIELTFRNPTDDVLMTYWQSYCLSTSSPTDDLLATQLVTLKELLKKANEELAKLKRTEGTNAPPTDQPLSASLVQKLVGSAGTAKMLPDEAELFTMAGFATFVNKMGFAHIDRGVYLPEIQRKAELMKQERDEAGWENYVLDYLKREKASGRLLTRELVGEPARAGFGPVPTAKVASSTYDLQELARRNSRPTV